MATIKNINGGGGPQGGNPMDNVDLTHAKTMKCEECGCLGFKQTLMLKKLSALESPNGQESIVPVAAFCCEQCGHINKEFLEIQGLRNRAEQGLLNLNKEELNQYVKNIEESQKLGRIISSKTESTKAKEAAIEKNKALVKSNLEML